MIILVYYVLQSQLICLIIAFIEFLWGKTLQQYTTIFVSKIFKIKYYKLKDSDDLYEKKCIYMANHKSWGDFLCDIHICANPIALSRYLVLVIFPVLFIGSLINNNVKFINIKKNTKEQFENIMNHIYISDWENSNRNILIYPEGKRYPNSIINPLKKGAIIYSFMNKIPIQLIISKNKESVVNEKSYVANIGTSIYTYYSEIIDPNKFNNIDDYIDFIINEWDKICIYVYDDLNINNAVINDINFKSFKLNISNRFRYGLMIFMFLFYKFIMKFLF